MSSDLCGKCNQKVMFVERAKFGIGYWHQQCFKCQACKKTLTAGAYSEHDNLPYCSSCFAKNFKPKGYGFGVNNINSYDTNGTVNAPPINANTFKETSHIPVNEPARVRSSVNQLRSSPPTTSESSFLSNVKNSVTSFFASDSTNNQPKSSPPPTSKPNVSYPSPTPTSNVNTPAVSSLTKNFCSDCGTKSTGGKFCTNCGAKL